MESYYSPQCMVERNAIENKPEKEQDSEKWINKAFMEWCCWATNNMCQECIGVKH